MEVTFQNPKQISDIFDIITDIKTEFNIKFSKDNKIIIEDISDDGGIMFNTTINMIDDNKYKCSQQKIAGIAEKAFLNFLKNISQCQTIQFAISKIESNKLLLIGRDEYITYKYFYNICDNDQSKEYPLKPKQKFDTAIINIDANKFYKIIKNNIDIGTIFQFNCTKDEFQIIVNDSDKKICEIKFCNDIDSSIDIKLDCGEKEFISINVTSDELKKIIKCNKITTKLTIRIYNNKFIEFINGISNGEIKCMICGNKKNEKIINEDDEEENQDEEEGEDDEEENQDDEEDEEDDEVF